MKPRTLSSIYGWTYDVFLSFRGIDTRTTFTGHLYNSLCRRGIQTFFDCEEVRRGEKITASLVKAIQESRIAIIVFSQNYASSTFCLDELVNIVEFIKGKNRLVWPVFYNVDPSEIRHCTGNFKSAFAKHEERFKDNKDKVLKWRLALREAADLSGWHFKSGYEYEHEFIERIVEEVSRKINHTRLHIANFPVGLEPPMLEVISLLGLESNDRVKMVGIYGIGGIGKSTIARAVYNYIADQFEGTCFLGDVRETSIKHGLVQLQKTLLCEAVGERNIDLQDVYSGIPMIKRRLQSRKILLVLDDVDKLEQLQVIAGGSDWFGCGSRIIITTRDKHLLAHHGVDGIYEVKELDHKEALELFSWNAFKSGEVPPNFLDISNRMVLYASGLPLALEVIGSHLFGKVIDEWSSALNKYESIPDKEIQKTLKVSYDGLDEEQKEIFLDIACCFKGESLATVTNILDACGFHPKYNIKVLVEKSLLKIDNNNCVSMHALIQSMGEKIVRQKSLKDVGKCSRLWSYDDIVLVLEEDMGSDKIQVIILNPHEKREVHWNGKAFKKMKRLRILIIRNTHFSIGPRHLPNSLRVLEWCGYPSSSLPNDFQGQKLVMLKLWDSCFSRDKPLKKFQSLSHMDFSYCGSLRQIPDLSGVPNLKKLVLDDCANLIEIHDSVGFLNKLETLSAYRCINLMIFPPVAKLPSLKLLILSGCASFWKFPEILEENRNELLIQLVDTAIEKLPSSIGNLKGLTAINLYGSTNLNRVPSSILKLPELKYFEANSCSRFQFFESCQAQEEAQVSSRQSSKYLSLVNCNLKDDFFHTCISSFYHVDTLNLSGNSFEVLPASFKQCLSVRRLYLDDCKKLREVQGIPPNIEYLAARNCTSLSSQSSSLLVGQAIRETNGKGTFIVTGERIPEWFDYYTNAASMSFWVLNRCPAIAFCIVLEQQSSSWGLTLDVEVNGTPNLRIYDLFGPEPVTDHIILCNQQVSSLRAKTLFLKDCQWNRVDVYVRTWRSIKVKCIAAYVNKQETSMKYIRFEDPYHGKRPFENACFTKLKRQRTLSLGRSRGARETSDTLQQLHSTIINKIIPTFFQHGNLSKHTENDFDALKWDPRSNTSVWNSGTISCQDSLQQQQLTWLNQQGAEECQSAKEGKGKSIIVHSSIEKEKGQEWISLCLAGNMNWDPMMRAQLGGGSTGTDKDLEKQHLISMKQQTLGGGCEIVQKDKCVGIDTEGKRGYGQNQMDVLLSAKVIPQQDQLAQNHTSETWDIRWHARNSNLR